MAVTTNSLYTILLLAQLVPYTVIIIGILFGDCRSKQFPAFYYTVFVFLTTHAIMYAYEGIVRSVIKVNYLLLIHHATFFVFMILEFVNQSNFVVKVGASIISSIHGQQQRRPLLVPSHMRRVDAPQFCCICRRV